jgi:Large polyvalent protein associated domain 29
MATIYIPARDVAKLVRAELKEAFPGQKFSVRTDHGTTLNIEWTDGPSDKTVSDLLDKYAGEGFDGMTDMRYSRENGGTDADGNPIRYLTDFVFTRRNISPELQAALRQELATAIAKESGTPLEEVLQDNRFWTAPQFYYREVDRGPWEQSLYVFVRVLAEARAAAAEVKA